MTVLFWICWVIDLLLLLVCLYETFAVSSNSSMAIPALLLAVLLGIAWWARIHSPRLALALAAIPAGLALVFALFFVISSMGRSNWQ